MALLEESRRWNAKDPFDSIFSIFCIITIVISTYHSTHFSFNNTNYSRLFTNKHSFNQSIDQLDQIKWMQRVLISNTLLLFLSKFDITPLDFLFQWKCIASDSSIVCICIALSDRNIHFHIFTRYHIECYGPFFLIKSSHHAIEGRLTCSSRVNITSSHSIRSSQPNQIKSHQHNYRVCFRNE